MVNAMKKNIEPLGYDKPRGVSKLEDQVFCTSTILFRLRSQR